MNHHQVVIEIPVYITVSNIEADSGAHAVALATSIVDHKALLERHPRPYDLELPMGTVLSIQTPDIATAAQVNVLLDDDTSISTQYEVSSGGEIFPSDVQPRIVVVEAARIAYDLLLEAIEEAQTESLRSKIQNAILSLRNSGIVTVPPTIEQQLEDDSPASEQDDPSQFENQVQSAQQEEPDETLISKILSIIPDQDETSFILQTPIFVATATDSTDPENVISGWEIQFGEISVLYKSKTIACIGTWREFSDPQIPYFDSDADVEVARTAILTINEFPKFFPEKPSMPDKLVAEIDMSLL
jgi:hypothetical protein